MGGLLLCLRIVVDGRHAAQRLSIAGSMSRVGEHFVLLQVLKGFVGLSVGQRIFRQHAMGRTACIKRTLAEQLMIEQGGGVALPRTVIEVGHHKEQSALVVVVDILHGRHQQAAGFCEVVAIEVIGCQLALHIALHRQVLCGNGQLSCLFEANQTAVLATFLYSWSGELLATQTGAIDIAHVAQVIDQSYGVARQRVDLVGSLIARQGAVEQSLREVECAFLALHQRAQTVGACLSTGLFQFLQCRGGIAFLHQRQGFMVGVQSGLTVVAGAEQHKG